MLCIRTTLCFFLALAVTTDSYGQFTDASGELGFSGGGKAAFGDYNNDGYVDLYSGKLWRNKNLHDARTAPPQATLTCLFENRGICAPPPPPHLGLSRVRLQQLARVATIRNY